MNLMPSKETLKTLATVVVALVAYDMLVKPMISKIKKTTPVATK